MTSTAEQREAVRAALAELTAADAQERQVREKGNEAYHGALIAVARATRRAAKQRDAIRSVEQAVAALGDRAAEIRAELLEQLKPLHDAAKARQRIASAELERATTGAEPLSGEAWHEVARCTYGATYVHTPHGLRAASAREVAEGAAGVARARFPEVEFRVRDEDCYALVEGRLAEEVDAHIVRHYLDGLY